MSETSPQDEPNTIPERTLHAVFSQDFWPQQVDGDKDATELGLLLATICRSGGGAGESFAAGELNQVISWAATGGMRLERTEGGYCFESYRNICGWSDLNAQWKQAGPFDLPLVANHSEIMDGLGVLPDLVWAGIRSQESNRWTERSGPTQAGKPHEAAMNILQIDVLLKSHKQPRGRLCLCYAQGSFWCWADARENYMMAFIRDSGNAASQQAIIRFGEAFLIG